MINIPQRIKVERIAPIELPVVVEEKSCESIQTKEVDCKFCGTHHFNRSNIEHQKQQYEMIAKIINKYGIYCVNEIFLHEQNSSQRDI
ncbi:MAG: hypothetical protein PHY02_09700 [Phycisphaerae bacterium]|nr:hypothetical protein [Phycisphaerae bacterium]